MKQDAIGMASDVVARNACMASVDLPENGKCSIAQGFFRGLFRCQSFIEHIGEPFDLFFDVFLRLRQGGAASDQKAFDFGAPLNQGCCFRIEFVFFLCHHLSLCIDCTRSHVSTE